MYVDTEGYVTVGIGNMLPNAAAARLLSFVNRTTKNSATSSEITADFDNVSKQKKAMRAGAYRQFTNLDMPNLEIDRLFRKRSDEFLVQLRSCYPKYDTFPIAARLAILDLAFNLGAAALKKKWPNLNDATEKQDWAAAAKNCLRPRANSARNTATVALFEKAGASK